MYSVMDPARGELVEWFPDATDRQVDGAIEQASCAWLSWRLTALPDRAAVPHPRGDLRAASFGLGASVFSEDEERAAWMAPLLECGMVDVNQPERSQADLPLGGITRSGVGRELGALGLKPFINPKVVRW